MKRLFSFRELGKPAQLEARKNLLREMESLFSHWKRVKGFVTSSFDLGIVVSPEDVYVTDDDNVIFLPREIVLDVALDKSGVGDQYLGLPEYCELFLANAKPNIRRVCPFPADARFVLISVDVAPFDNNDNGCAFFVCEVAASVLETYLNHLVVTISNSFRAAIVKEHARISSPAYLDRCLQEQGEVFEENGKLAPIFEKEDGAL